MTNSLLVKFETKSIVKQEYSDVYFIVTEEVDGNVYRVMPRGFQIHSEPYHPVKFYFGNKFIIL